MRKSCVVSLTPEERAHLERLVNSGRTSSKKQTHARILLKADTNLEGPAWPDRQICEALEISSSCEERVRKRFVEEGLEAALNRRVCRRPSRRLLDGEQEARLLALACSTPAQGNGAWTLRLLTDRMVALEYVESISYETVRRVLKNEIKPHLKQCWCIPPAGNAEFVCRMEDILEVYTRPLDPQRPVVCMDETSKQLLAETRIALPPQPGQVERYDYEYSRNGVANLFLAFEPLSGWRHVEVTQQRRRQDWAEFVRDLLDGRYA
jgi:transposase